MTDEQKVYILGVEGRGDEVIKTLEDLGATNSNEYKCCYVDYLYYIGHDGNIHCEYEEREEAKIIMDNYIELHLPDKWKDGDWKDGDILIRKDNNNNHFCVYQKPVDNGKGFLCHVFVSKDTLFTGVIVPSEAADKYRKATDTEELTFYALVSDHHMYWDAENKALVSWEHDSPHCGQKYYAVSAYGTVVDNTWCDSSVDKALLRAGNWFFTEEEAEAAAERVKKALKGE